MTKQDDRVTVGVNADAQEALDLIRQATPYFPDELDAYRFAIAHSIGSRLATDDAPPRGVETKFNVGTLDRDGRLRELIVAAFPERSARPYAFAEYLAHKGLMDLRVQMVESRRPLQEILGFLEESAHDADTDAREHGATDES